MTMARIIATVWTRVSSSGKPMSTMRSGRQAFLIKIEACGGLGQRRVLRGWCAPSRKPSSAQHGGRAALCRPNESADHVSGDTAAESDDEHFEPVPPP